MSAADKPGHVNALTDIQHQACEWMVWVEAVRLTHYARGDAFRKRNNAIGLAAVVFSTVISAGILTSIHKSPGFWWTVAGAVVALSAALLTGIRSYLKLDVLSESHRKAGAKFGEVYRDLEIFVLSNPTNDASARDQLSRIADRIGKLEEVGPGYPSAVFQKKFDKVKKRPRKHAA